MVEIGFERYFRNYQQIHAIKATILLIPSALFFSFLKKNKELYEKYAEI
jgi:hypothetical protein